MALKKVYCVCGHEMVPTNNCYGTCYTTNPPSYSTLYEYKCTHCGAIVANHIPYDTGSEKEEKHD